MTERPDGTEFTPDTATIRTFYTSDTDGNPLPGRAAQFNRWLETVRAEAKQEALEEAASAYPVMLRDMVSRGSVAAWLRDRTKQYSPEADE
ncbi:hypothetical protein QMQ05_05695 [Glutamicibacter ectropisis]|uniref:Uncharacterized protein n=1 Tax=Glutamicibacter ectropisis TaxID=3046593 RepID=A0AAU6WH59_9MICC